ncbi:hypothetical protein [Hymenobacter arizonensis]|uniref:SpoIIAA-like n=1 Tax=Hymenobacter arizonensis TaxID=1227077 RepID=A0A1I5XYU7_HYMAR|nr:hypothetical protein [Hymenobacter arizonensis]SFQ37115.1 hypothetical protein SAMN04515668_2124 [Hymenobacter arizonensis]
MTEEDLYPSYARLLAAAQEHGNCRFWLLDMRQRAWHSAAFAAWFSGLLAQQVVRELGAPVFVAYVASEEHRATIESISTAATLRKAAKSELYPHFFNNEKDAAEWLCYYQTHSEWKSRLQST